VDIRDFIDGTPEQKNQFGAMVLQASFAFSAQLIMLCHHHADGMSDEMKSDLIGLLDSFHMYVSEFIDFEELQNAMEAEAEERDT